MADDFDALRYSVSAIQTLGSWFICLACGMPTGFRDPVHVSDGRHRGTWELDDDENGALGRTGDLDAPGTSAGWGILWPDSMHILDYPQDLDDEPERPA